MVNWANTYPIAITKHCHHQMRPETEVRAGNSRATVKPASRKQTRRRPQPRLPILRRRRARSWLGLSRRSSTRWRGSTNVHPTPTSWPRTSSHAGRRFSPKHPSDSRGPPQSLLVCQLGNDWSFLVCHLGCDWDCIRNTHRHTQHRHAQILA